MADGKNPYDEIGEFIETGSSDILMSRSWLCKKWGCKEKPAGSFSCDDCELWAFLDSIDNEIMKLGLEYMKDSIKSLKGNLVQED